jgi:hypothetical protein
MALFAVAAQGSKHREEIDGELEPKTHDVIIAHLFLPFWAAT